MTVTKTGEGFTVEAAINFPVSVRAAWDVLTDFDDMPAILSNLTSSKTIRRNGNTLLVAQEGKARYGLLSYSFASEREIRLEPMKRILSRQISGNAKVFESEATLQGTATGCQLRYHAQIVPDSGLAGRFGGPFIQHEIEEQFLAMGAEMERREKP